MQPASSAVADLPFELKFGQVGIANLRVFDCDAAALQAELSARVSAAPQLFARAPLVLDPLLCAPERTRDRRRAGRYLGAHLLSGFPGRAGFDRWPLSSVRGLPGGVARQASASLARRGETDRRQTIVLYFVAFWKRRIDL